MDHDEIVSRVCAMVSEELDVELDSLNESTRLKELGADSFDLLQLITALEDDFSLTLDDDSLQAIETISDAVKTIEAAL